MSFTSTLLAAAAVLTVLTPLSAGRLRADEAHPPQIHVHDSYARSSTATSGSGAAFMVLHNGGATDDRLVAARSDVAERVELHTHIQDANGVMRMVEVTEGLPIPAGETHALERGGDHVMFLGLRRPLHQGDTIELTLIFETAGAISVAVPVDLERKPGQGGMMHQHGQTMNGQVKKN